MPQQPPEFSYPAKSYLWQKALSSESEGKGPYFPVQDLRKIFVACNRHAKKLWGRLLRWNRHEGFYAIMRNKLPEAAALADQMVEFLEEKGLRRLAYAGEGRHSLFFFSTPDRSDRQQLIGLTPTEDKYFDCPLLLPAIEHCNIENGDDSLRLRVMPALKTGEAVKQEDEVKIVNLLSAMGVNCDEGEFDSCNMGILEFTNDKGVKKNVPLIFDWGVLIPVQGERLAVLQKQWKNIPELADWYEAQAYLRKHYEIENVAGSRRHEVWEMRRAGFDSGNPQEYVSAIEAAEKHGLYVPEAAKFAADAQKESGKPFAEQLEDKIEKADLSQFHKGK